MKIWHLTPFRGDLNIGKAYNDFCAEVPEDDWICIRDMDTMFLLPDSGKLVEDIVRDNPGFDLIGCLTNRLRSNYQSVSHMFNNEHITEHIIFASNQKEIYNTCVINVNSSIAGMFMLFPKKTWNNHKFIENNIFCDKWFSESILNAGGKLGIAQGLYIFHLYRWGSNRPFTDISHLHKKR